MINKFALRTENPEIISIMLLSVIFATIPLITEFISRVKTTKIIFQTAYAWLHYAKLTLYFLFIFVSFLFALEEITGKNFFHLGFSNRAWFISLSIFFAIDVFIDQVKKSFSEILSYFEKSKKA